eukprot:4716842-Heterocapsa_arctica.AAC.1
MPPGGVAVEQVEVWIHKLEELPSASRAGQEVLMKKLEQLMVEEAAYFREQAAVIEELDRRHGVGERRRQRDHET